MDTESATNAPEAKAAVSAKNALVIRLTQQGPIDPLREIDDVIAKVGTCWFGKLGRPLSPVSLRRAGGLPSTLVLLVNLRHLADSSSPTWHHRAYRLLDVWHRRVPPRDEYPEYYREFLPMISTWFKLGPAHQISIDSLVTRSSGQRVIESMRNSMGSFFYCRRLDN